MNYHSITNIRFWVRVNKVKLEFHECEKQFRSFKKLNMYTNLCRYKTKCRKKRINNIQRKLSTKHRPEKPNRRIKRSTTYSRDEIQKDCINRKRWNGGEVIAKFWWSKSYFRTQSETEKLVLMELKNDRLSHLNISTCLTVTFTWRFSHTWYVLAVREKNFKTSTAFFSPIDHEQRLSVSK